MSTQEEFTRELAAAARGMQDEDSSRQAMVRAAGAFGSTLAQCSGSGDTKDAGETGCRASR
ncbi:MAG: hypothetical protein H7231_05660 [Rhodoferax sp.]|nr:hypothetical protein [Actinomycetota bacterium]